MRRAVAVTEAVVAVIDVEMLRRQAADRLHVLADLGLSGQFPVLQMGMSYPVDAELVAELSQLCERRVVIEERRSFLEKNTREALFQKLAHDRAVEISGRLFGKRFPSAAGVVAEAMVALVLANAALEKFGGDSVAETRRNFESYLKQLADRGLQVRTQSLAQP